MKTNIDFARRILLEISLNPMKPLVFISRKTDIQHSHLFRIKQEFEYDDLIECERVGRECKLLLTKKGNKVLDLLTELCKNVNCIK